MDLKNLIRPQLWAEISNSYIAENYKGAILDAMRYLSKVIREKSGVDGDGTQLVGQAFGGDDPKLRLNRLQTQSEKDEQKGFQFIISGLYSAVRNPRTHEDIQDDKNTADPIIYFVNYVLNVIDVAKPPFTIEDFLPRVLDAAFVVNEVYTQELIKEIPKNRYYETLIEIYRRKSNGLADALSYVVRQIFTHLTSSEINEFVGVVSAELDIVTKNDTIIRILRILPSEYWSMVKLTAKMRIENKLIESIRLGESSMLTPVVYSGALGTWATRIIDQLTLKKELTEAIVASLAVDSYRRNRYILTYFLPYLPNLITDSRKYRYCALAMKRVIKFDDQYIKEKISDFLGDCPDDWLNAIESEFRDWTDPDHPEIYLRNGSPLWGKIPYENLVELPPEDDIPF